MENQAPKINIELYLYLATTNFGLYYVLSEDIVGAVRKTSLVIGTERKKKIIFYSIEQLTQTRSDKRLIL